MKIYLSIFLLLFFKLSSFEYELGVTAIFQNEARFLPEWIEYHKQKGVQHFWLYNNNSTDEYAAALKPYIKTGLVELIEWPSVQNENDWSHFSFEVQPKAYEDALKRARNKTKWLAIIDTDEFIFPLKNKSIRSFLKEKKEYGQVQLGWILFGTSNIERTEKGSMLKQLVYRAHESYGGNQWSKSIVKPHQVEKCNNPHYCILKKPFKSIQIERNEARINHYWTRDNEFLMHVKVARYLKWGIDPSGSLKKAQDLNMVYDDLILH